MREYYASTVSLAVTYAPDTLANTSDKIEALCTSMRKKRRGEYARGGGGVVAR